MYPLKVHPLGKQGLTSLVAAFCSSRVFIFLISGATRAPLRQGPRRRVAGQSRTPPAPDPAHLARALVLRGPPSAAMGSEMEPLLLAWSYFRRRKFQLCADLCTQMLEKSPYDQVPAGPCQPCGSQREAEGTGGSPGRWVGAPGRKAQGELDRVVSIGIWNPFEPGWLVLGGGVPESPRDSRVPRHGRPSSNLNSPFPLRVPLRNTLKNPEFYFGAELW